MERIPGDRPVGSGRTGQGDQPTTEQAKRQGQQLAQQARQQAGRLENRGGEQVNR